MIPLCRHILTSGLVCSQAAMHGTHFCRHHQTVKSTLAQASQPAPCGAPPQLPLVFPEDRAAIQLNLFLVLQALNDGRIDNRTANSMNRLINSCAANLANGPLVEADLENTVQRVILTPEGDEIAAPREALEEGENPPLHHKGCPCRRCAEEFRNAAPEQHHQNCTCGLCEDSPSRHTRFAPDTAVEDQPSGPAEPRSLNTRQASAEKLYTKELTLDPVNKPFNLTDYLYGDHHKKHEAQYAARARAAIEAGLEPPPYEPFDPNKIESKSARMEREDRARIEANREAARLAWNKRYPDKQEEPTPYLTWGEQHDLKLAKLKQLQEEDEARVCAQAAEAAAAQNGHEPAANPMNP
jgi:hypothetical protein